MNQSDLPADLRYSAEHEWVSLADGVATVGITAFAADALGDVVYVDLPAVGTAVAAGAPCGEIESTKSVSDLFSPVTGEVTEVNPAVVDEPGLLNSDPFGAWLLRVRVESLPDLLDAAGYRALTAGQG